ncbi:MAG: anti-sigma factor family protein [Terriglobia bacterium]
MNCKQAWKEISAYLDGETSADLKRLLEEHIGRCEHCKVVFDTTRKAIELYCDGKLFPMPVVVRDRLHEALQRKLKQKAV